MYRRIVLVVIVIVVSFSCSRNISKEKSTVRDLKDTIGFTQYNWQLDSIFSRIDIADLQKTENTYKEPDEVSNYQRC